jgi:MFS family permease
MDKNISDQLLKPKDRIEMPLISAFTISMFTIFTLSVSCYSVIAPFMPIEIVKKGVDESVMGWIIGVFSLALILMAPVMGWIIERVGRRNPIIFGSFLLGVSFEMFAIIHYIEEKTMFVTLLFIFRIIQGIATVLI